MIDFERACEMAEEYYQKTIGIGYSDRILEDKESWFFCSGKSNAIRIGNIIISVNKSSGKIEELPMPSHETIKTLKAATLVNR